MFHIKHQVSSAAYFLSLSCVFMCTYFYGGLELNNKSFVSNRRPLTYHRVLQKLRIQDAYLSKSSHSIEDTCHEELADSDVLTILRVSLNVLEGDKGYA